MPIKLSTRGFWSILRLLIMFVIIEPTRPIELLEFGIPKFVLLGVRASLSCRWQLGPADVLYSVKWYKDGKEFFRHLPRDVEPRRRFPLPGVDVEESNSAGSKLVLAPATLETSGRYRCEVSGERPLFRTVSDYADMDIIALPEHGPSVSGFLSRYSVGDRVLVNCTSAPSRPATQLSWYINGEPLSTEEYPLNYRTENATTITSLMLDFEVREVNFRKNKLKVKCLATITPFYWKSIEETAVLKNKIYQSPKTSSRNYETAKAEKIHVNVANSSGESIFANNFICLTFGVVFGTMSGAIFL